MWTIKELEKLLQYAGAFPLNYIATKLNKTEEQIDNACFLLDLDVSYPQEREIIWCDECATWRVVRLSNGYSCPICSKMKSNEKSINNQLLELSIMSIEDRNKFLDMESKLGDRTRKRPTETGDLYADDEAMYSYLEAVYCRNRTRLKRMRIVNGTSPIRNKKRCLENGSEIIEQG